jgi:hypothetical protein
MGSQVDRLRIRDWSAWLYQLRFGGSSKYWCLGVRQMMQWLKIESLKVRPNHYLIHLPGYGLKIQTTVCFGWSYPNYSNLMWMILVPCCYVCVQCVQSIKYTITHTWYNYQRIPFVHQIRPLHHTAAIFQKTRNCYFAYVTAVGWQGFAANANAQHCSVLSVANLRYTNICMLTVR